MNIKILGIAFGAALVALSSCNSMKTIPASNLAGNWDITELSGKKVKSNPEGENPSISFDVVNGSVSGSTGCNRMMGNFHVQGTSIITFSKMGTTRMMCPDMETEQSVLNALNNAKSFMGMNNDKVVFFSADGKEVMTLKKATPSITEQQIQGEWNITQVNGNDVAPTEEGPAKWMFDSSEHQFSCFTGCNTLGGSYQMQGNAISMELSLSTMRDCPNMDLENVLKQVIPSIVAVDLLPTGYLAFTDANHNVVLLLGR